MINRAQKQIALTCNKTMNKHLKIEWVTQR